VRDRASGSTCVRKVVLAEGLPSATRRMLLAEGRVLQRLSHPGIVRLLGSSEDDSAAVLTLVLEHLTGGDCGSLRRRHGGHLGEKAVARLTRQLLLALGHCHAHGVVHRDVNASNIVLVDGPPRWNCKLIDFGYAACDAEVLTDVVGTAPYMAPEMLQRRPRYTYKVDIWSAGAFACELLTGSPPFGRPGHDGVTQADLYRRARGHTESCRGAESKELFAHLPRWAELSAGARSFLCFLLCAHPEERPTAEEAAAHPWLEEHWIIPSLHGG